MPVTTTQFIYPSQAELFEIDQDFVSVLTASNPIFRQFPVTPRNSALVMWEQRSNWLGLMQARGQEGQYPAVPMVPRSRYSMQPGHYGEVAHIYGKEIEERRGSMTFTGPVDVSDLVLERQEQLATRHFSLMAWLLWTLCTTGYYVAYDRAGTIVQREAVGVQAYNFTVNIDLLSTAAPLAEFRAIKLLARGRSVTFDGRAEAWMNSTTWNAFIANTNPADLGGRKAAGLETIEGLDQYNRLATRDNLPSVVEYDDGYNDQANVFHTWIPDWTIVLFGRRTTPNGGDGPPIGNFALTRNVDAGNRPAPLVKVVRKGQDPNDPPPVEIGVYRGFNGGPMFLYPGAMVVINARPS